MTLPIVLVEIDRNSRVRILRHDGVCVAFLDRRVDPTVVLLPELNQALELDSAIADCAIMTLGGDDPPKTAAETIRRLDAGEIVVAAGPSFPTPHWRHLCDRAVARAEAAESRLAKAVEALRGITRGLTIDEPECTTSCEDPHCPYTHQASVRGSIEPSDFRRASNIVEAHDART